MGKFPAPQIDKDGNEIMRDLCLKCFRPKAYCYCKFIKKVDSGIKFVFLMHPKEAKKQKTGTGRLAHLSLPESEIIVGIDFTKNERVCALIKDPHYYPLLLYPGKDAWTCSKKGFKETLGQKKLLVFVVDSTWFCSKKMLKLSTNITSLPKFSFEGSYKSIFTFKKEPEEYCLSTIESCYYLIKEMQSSSLVEKSVNPEPLMDVFKKMIVFQLEKENERIDSGLPGTHMKDVVYTKKKIIPTFD